MGYRDPSDDRRDETERDRQEAAALLAGMNKRRGQILVVVAILGAVLIVGGFLAYPAIVESTRPHVDSEEELCTKSGGKLTEESSCDEDFATTCLCKDCTGGPGSSYCPPTRQQPHKACECPRSLCWNANKGCIADVNAWR
jgi:hypothetical protein